MIEKAKKKIEQRILTEKEKIRSELVDSAINIAMEKLPGEMTDEDNKKFIDYYLSHEFS